MPLIVDKEAVRMEILMAFQRCIDRKPLTNVSLRDIAAEANMSHAKLLNYFDSKEDLLVSYVRYTRDYMSQKCLAWFNEHDRADYGVLTESVVKKRYDGNYYDGRQYGCKHGYHRACDGAYFKPRKYRRVNRNRARRGLRYRRKVHHFVFFQPFKVFDKLTAHKRNYYEPAAESKCAYIETRSKKFPIFFCLVHANKNAPCEYYYTI